MLYHRTSFQVFHNILQFSIRTESDVLLVLLVPSQSRLWRGDYGTIIWIEFSSRRHVKSELWRGGYRTIIWIEFSNRWHVESELWRGDYGTIIWIEFSSRRHVQSELWRGGYRTIVWIEFSSRRHVKSELWRGDYRWWQRRNRTMNWGYSDGFRWRWGLWAHRNRRGRNDGDWGWTIRFLLKTTCLTFYSIQPRKGDAYNSSTCDF